MKTEIFRFTAIRTPQQIESNKITENTVSLFKKGEESSLVSVLREARKAGFERILAVAAQFTKTEHYIKSMKDVPLSYSDFNDFLLANPGNMAISNFSEQVSNCFGEELKVLIASSNFRHVRDKIANSLLVSLILGNSATQHQNVQSRLLHIIGILEKVALAKIEPIEVSKLLSSSFILPKQIFPLPFMTKELSEDVINQQKEEQKIGKQKKEERKKAVEQIEKLKETFFDIQTKMEEDKVRINSSNNPKARITKGGFYLEASSGNKLSQLSKSVIGSLNFNVQKIDTSILLPKIETQISALASKLFQEVTFDSKVYKIGNTFVVDYPSANSNEVTNYDRPGSCPITLNPTEVNSNEAFVPDTKGSAHVLGIMDLLVVEQELLHYEKGEIAHVENVLLSEIRERKHRRTLTREESTFTESEDTEEKEKDLTSTERYELQTESQNVINEASTYEAGVTANYYGVRFDVSAHANVSGSSSTTQSNTISSGFARDITTKAVNKITNRTLTRRFKKSVDETEENNLHSFNNVEGDGNITGVYRWLDKIYNAQVVKYGKRLMLEFMVPEPAAFYRYAAQQQPTETVTFLKPEQPGYCSGGKTFRPLRATDLTRDNYIIWANKYNAGNITPPPPTYQIIGESFAKGRTDLYVETVDDDFKFYHSEKLTLQMPSGYYPETAKVLVDFNYIDISDMSGEDEARISVGIEDKQKIFKAENNNKAEHTDILGTFQLSKYSTSALPITITSVGVLSFGINITVSCKLLNEKFEEWQLKTYASIMEAYNEQKARYDGQLEAIRIQQGFGGNITGKNPIFNRETERTELKKGCITLLTGQRFEKFNAVQKNVIYYNGKYGQPEIVNFEDAQAEGKYIQYFEQSIEWTNMLYSFYPYFWAEKSQWTQLSQLNDTDSLFTKFLQAGSARVQVPVRPGFEYSLLTYLKTGQIWQAEGDFVDVNEDGLPDELQISILDELKEGIYKADDNSTGEFIGEPWKVRVPTNLVIIEENNDSLIL